MKFNKIILPSIALATVMASCDDKIMEWQDKDNTVDASELPLKDSEKLKLYKPIKEYVAQYHPSLNLALGTGADTYLNDEDAKAIIDANFTGLTLGNAMKMGVIMNASGKIDFTTVDNVIAAMPAGMKLYGHNLLWHTQQQQTYLKSLIAPKLEIKSEGNVANVLMGDASDFNGGTTGGWGAWGSNKDEAGVDATGGSDGSGALKLKNKGDGNAWEAQCAYDFDIPLKKDVAYVIKFKAKSTTAAGEIQFQYQNNQTYGSQGGYNTFSVGTDWTDCEYEFTITAFDDVNRILLNFGKVGGTYWIDDIQFGEKVEDAMDNILVGDNSDFEGGTKGKWGSWGNESTSGVADEGYNSAHSMFLTNPKDGADYYMAQACYETDIPLTVGTTYIIQFWAKSTTPAGGLQFCVQNRSTYAGEGYWNIENVGTEWTMYEHEYTCTKEGMNGILINFGKVPATYYIDNIKFGEKKDQGKARSRAASRAATATYILKTPEEKKAILLEAMESWIKTMTEHVGDRVDAWDVINEPIADGSNEWRGINGVFGSSNNDGVADSEPVETETDGLNLNWASDAGNQHWYWGYYLGKDYAVKAFQFARQYAPNAKLFVNDYNLEVSPSKLDALIKMVEYIDQNGGQVDGIGTQMHVNYKITKEQVDAMFKKLASTGKLIRITELDVAFGVEEGKTITPSEAQLSDQAAAYQMILTSYFENIPEAQQSAITIWGFSDNKKEHEYWLKGDAPNIFDADYNRKIAYKGVCDAIAGYDVSTDFKGEDWKNLHEGEDENPDNSDK